MSLKHLVTTHGVLPADQAVLDWLDEIDLYIQPSLTEGLPRAVIEAMDTGCIVYIIQAVALQRLWVIQILYMKTLKN